MLVVAVVYSEILLPSIVMAPFALGPVFWCKNQILPSMPAAIPPGLDDVAALTFDVVEEGEHQVGVDILDRQITRPSLEPLGGEAHQQSEGMGIGRDRVRAGITLARKMLAQECGQVGSKGGHAASSLNRRSLAAAMSRSSTGVASRYQ